MCEAEARNPCTFYAVLKTLSNHWEIIRLLIVRGNKFNWHVWIRFLINCKNTVSNSQTRLFCALQKKKKMLKNERKQRRETNAEKIMFGPKIDVRILTSPKKKFILIFVFWRNVISHLWSRKENLGKNKYRIGVDQSKQIHVQITRHSAIVLRFPSVPKQK